MAASAEVQQNKDELPFVDMTYAKEVRKATKDVHKISDLLVNAKFAFALSDDAVWAEGLLCFYEIFKYLETHLPVELLPKELHRTEAFEKDLTHFLGANWQDNYEPRASVKKYLQHLEQVRAKSQLLLFAYAYHMYMALLSGGQILQKKRLIARKLWFAPVDNSNAEDKAAETEAEIDNLEQRDVPKQVTLCAAGYAATFFPEKMHVLKLRMRQVLNAHYGKFDEQMRADFIEESRNVFLYNNNVLRTIKGVNWVNFRKVSIFVMLLVGIYFAIRLATL